MTSMIQELASVIASLLFKTPDNHSVSQTPCCLASEEPNIQ